MSTVYVLTGEPYHDNSTVLGVFFTLAEAEAAAIGHLKAEYERLNASETPYRPVKIEGCCGVIRVDNAGTVLTEQKCTEAFIQIRFRGESGYMPWDHLDNEQLGDYAGHVIYRNREDWKELA